MSEHTFRQICELLEKNSIRYDVMSHAPIITSEEAARVRGRNIARAAKALILRSEGRFIQFVVPGDKKLDMKKAKQVLSTKSLSLASREEVQEVTDCTPGSVPPFGNLWSIPVYADKQLSQEFDFSAGVHDKSITIARDDWESVVSPRIVDVTQ